MLQRESPTISATEPVETAGSTAPPNVEGLSGVLDRYACTHPPDFSIPQLWAATHGKQVVPLRGLEWTVPCIFLTRAVCLLFEDFGVLPREVLA